MWPRTIRLVAVLIIVACHAGEAWACLVQRGVQYSDLREAEVVVVGRIIHYETVLDEVSRERFRARLARRPRQLSPLESEQYWDDYVRLDILVEEELFGKAPTVLSATWNANSVGGEPQQAPRGLLMIGLRKPDPNGPEIRDGDRLMVVDNGCSSKFMIDNLSHQADMMRRHLGAPERRPLEKPLLILTLIFGAILFVIRPYRIMAPEDQ